MSRPLFSVTNFRNVTAEDFKSNHDISFYYMRSIKVFDYYFHSSTSHRRVIDRDEISFFEQSRYPTLSRNARANCHGVAEQIVWRRFLSVALLVPNLRFRESQADRLRYASAGP